jgi:D-glycero-D-manno-heptose 1,7-bisphosphate phosphatase
VAEGLRALRERGYRLVVVTNQAGVARGKYTEEDVDAVHQRIAQLADRAANSRGLIDRFYYCPYHPDGTVEEYRQDHPWRKPHPGMLLQAAHDMDLDLSESWMIGDQDRDIDAGRSAGCRTVLLNGKGTLSANGEATAVAGDFAEAVEIVISQSRGHAKNADSPRRVDDSSRADSQQSDNSSRRTTGGEGVAELRRAVVDLTEQLRQAQAHRTEFTHLKMIAVVCQLLVLLQATLGLLQLSQPEVFYQWMIGAVLTQLLTISLVLLDGRS